MTARLKLRTDIASRKEYDRVFIVEDRDHWNICSMQYNKETDLVLSMDFGLFRSIENKNGMVFFVDHLLEKNYANELNYELHHFLNKWYLDKDGQDIFAYKGIPVSSAFILNIVNDVALNYHFFVNLITIKDLQFSEIICAVEDKIVRQWVGRLYPAALFIDKTIRESESHTYYFPVSKWMASKIDTDSLSKKIRQWGVLAIETLQAIREFLLPNKQPAVFIQNYYPTAPIIDHLKKSKTIKLILSGYTSKKNALGERRISFKNEKISDDIIKTSLKKFETMDRYELIIDDFNIAEVLYETFAPRLPDLLQKAYSGLETISRYFKKTDLKLMVPVTELWLQNKLLINYCKHNNIPVFLIINGILAANYSYDAKDIDWVNCYSEAIKMNYFKGKENALCLGDPRMDHYSGQQKKPINRTSPTIMIGAGCYNMTDMNSYLAFEFDFLYDILEALEELKKEGYDHQVVLKTRENAHVSQVDNFLAEYFPKLNVRVEKEVPFKVIVQEADFYISIYSQTLLEAASLGIPALYYKKDLHIVDPPFDGYSEVVTPLNKEELKDCLYAFYKADNRYDKFLEKEVLEKYIGFLDGKNLQRNIDFINSFLLKEKSERPQFHE